MIKEKFGKRLRHLRQERTDFSQENFAYQINMDRTYYSSVENGKRNISLENIEKIAVGLGITLEELFRNIEEE